MLIDIFLPLTNETYLIYFIEQLKTFSSCGQQQILMLRVQMNLFIKKELSLHFFPNSGVFVRCYTIFFKNNLPFCRFEFIARVIYSLRFFLLIYSISILFMQGGCEYEDWAIYCGYFNSYETELEYLSYWKELLKELKVCAVYITKASNFALLFGLFGWN